MLCFGNFRRYTEKFFQDRDEFVSDLGSICSDFLDSSDQTKLKRQHHPQCIDSAGPICPGRKEEERTKKSLWFPLVQISCN